MKIGEDELAVISISMGALAELPDLTAAEFQVVERVLQGQSNHEIAQGRGTALRTVANQLASIFRKLGISSRTELMAAVMEGRFRATGARTLTISSAGEP
jgi:DNA-binding CsgD family transcriptional regulator